VNLRFGRGAGVAASCVLAAAALAGDAPRGGELPKTPDEALAWSKPAIEAARKAKSAETSDVVKGIRRAVDWMQPHFKAGSSIDAWAAAWNEALTLSRFHQLKPTFDYAMEQVTAVRNSIQFGVPKGRGWRFDAKTPGKDEQSWGVVSRTLSDGRKAADIDISEYRFDTIYSGTGGENAAELAKDRLLYDREQFSKVDSSSQQAATRSLGKGFSRAYYVEVVGTLAKDAGPGRMRTWFTKGKVRTYAFDVTEFRATAPTDDPFVAWQKSVEDPELEAVLRSIDEVEPKKK